jgi:hypothetical protein
MPVWRQRIGILLITAAVVVSMVLLAASLRQADFSPGYPLPAGEREEETTAGMGMPVFSRYFEYLYMAFLVLSVIFLPLSILYLIVSPEARRNMLRNLVLLSWLALLFLLVRGQRRLFEELELLPGVEEPVAPLEAAATVEFVAQPPPWAVTALAILLALLLAAAIVGLVWALWLRLRPPESPLEQLAGEAQGALRALQAGADLRDTILRCYAEMSRAVSAERGLRREAAMTPREFERRLAEAGLPGAPVRQLTRLFEAVRYGAWTPGAEEERQAVACLNDILTACAEPACRGQGVGAYPDRSAGAFGGAP